MEEVLFDTDIGSDIDDAVALAFRRHPPSVEPHQPRAPQAARLDVDADRFFATYFEVF